MEMSSAKIFAPSPTVCLQTLIIFQWLQTVSFSWTTAILLDHSSGAESGWASHKRQKLLQALSFPSSAAVNVLFKYGIKEGVIYTELENLFKFNVI